MILALAILAASTLPGDEAGVDYSRDVKPLLMRRCVACHGALRTKAGLRLDTAAGLLKGGDGGPAIEPAHSDESILIERVIDQDPSFRMPPEGEGERLSDEEVTLLRRWIDAGAQAPEAEEAQADPRDHWAFRPPVRPEVPALPGHSPNPIDAFLEARRREAGVVAAPEADRATLIRRVMLDLTGIAPTPGQVATFEADPAPDAYEQLVDRLLASPRYGERWGRHWMDVWRYSDWYGFGAEMRNSQPHLWRWRDWIVESLNDDAGYDRMVTEMLAGDEIAPADPDTLRATGYLARSWYKFNRNVWLQDIVEHTSKAFLGLTFNCARCHDHKYDPISQADYYRLRAVFEPHEIRLDRVPGQPDPAADGVARVYDAHADRPTYLFARGDEKQPVEDHPLEPGIPRFLGATFEVEPISLPPIAYHPALRPHIRAEAIAAAESVVSRTRDELEAAVAATVDATATADGEPALKRQAAAGLALAAAQAELASIRTRIEADDARFADPPNPDQVGCTARLASKAQRQAAALRAEAELARLESELADAERKADPKVDLAALRNGLEPARKARDEARAAVEPESAAYDPLLPSYPPTSTGRRRALARWITSPENPTAARVAVNHVWMRHFGRPLVPTVFDFGLNGRPPSHPGLLDWLAVELRENGWSLKHLHRLMVTSDAYRMAPAGPDNPDREVDPSNALYGHRDPIRMEAELVRDNLLALAGTLDPSMGGLELPHDQALTTARRSLYYRHAPEKQAVFLKLFDAANTTACYRRDVSVMPQQSLALLNSPLALEASRRLAARLTGGCEDDASFLGSAFAHILGRPPTEEERAACLGFLRDQAARLADPASMTPTAGGAEGAIPAASDPAHRAREGLVHVLINHNDFVTIR